MKVLKSDRTNFYKPEELPESVRSIVDTMQTFPKGSFGGEYSALNNKLKMAVWAIPGYAKDAYGKTPFDTFSANQTLKNEFNAPIQAAITGINGQISSLDAKINAVKEKMGGGIPVLTLKSTEAKAGATVQQKRMSPTAAAKAKARKAQSVERGLAGSEAGFNHIRAKNSAVLEGIPTTGRKEEAAGFADKTRP